MNDFNEEAALLTKAAIALATDNLRWGDVYDGMKADREPLASHVALVRSIRTKVLARMDAQGLETNGTTVAHLVSAVVDLAIRTYHSYGSDSARPGQPESWLNEAIGAVLEGFGAFTKLP